VLEDRLLHQSRGLVSGSMIWIGGGYQFYAAHASEGWQMHPSGNIAASDHAYSEFSFHATEHRSSADRRSCMMRTCDWVGGNVTEVMARSNAIANFSNGDSSLRNRDDS
jgi:hypothetical protein